MKGPGAIFKYAEPTLVKMEEPALQVPYSDNSPTIHKMSPASVPWGFLDSNVNPELVLANHPFTQPKTIRHTCHIMEYQDLKIGFN